MIETKNIELIVDKTIRKKTRKFLKKKTKGADIKYKEKWRFSKSTFIIKISGEKWAVSLWCRLAESYFNIL